MPKRHCRRSTDRRPDFHTAGGIPEPTHTLPGSEDRITALAKRARAGHQLFAEGDAGEDARRGPVGGFVPNGKPVNTGRVIDQTAYASAPGAIEPERREILGGTIVPPLGLSLASRLRILRKRAGLSQRDLARKASLGRRTIKAYEYGEREPSVSVALLLSFCLGVSVVELIGDVKSAA